MNRILFPTDFSEAANDAFVYVLHLARKLNAEIYTVHAYSLPDLKGVNLPTTLRGIYESITLEQFENYRDAVPVLHEIAKEKGFADIKMYHIMEEGPSVRAILRTIERDNIQLVVMGTKGAGWLREVFIGSVTAEVLEQSPVPVIAVPKEVTFDGTIDHIAFAIEIKEEEKEVIQWLLNFAKHFEAVVTCLHIDVSHTEPYSHKMEEFASNFSDIPNLRFQVVNGIDTISEVADYVQENNFDMVAMTTHKRNFWQELWNYSMTKQMTRVAHAPILCLKSGMEPV